MSKVCHDRDKQKVLSIIKYNLMVLFKMTTGNKWRKTLKNTGSKFAFSFTMKIKFFLILWSLILSTFWSHDCDFLYFHRILSRAVLTGCQVKSEGVAWRCSTTKSFWKLSQNSLRKTCSDVFKLQACNLQLY